MPISPKTAARFSISAANAVIDSRIGPPVRVHLSPLAPAAREWEMALMVIGEFLKPDASDAPEHEGQPRAWRSE